MCAWGSSTRKSKFHKGAVADTPWNNDLLWRHHVFKETVQAKVDAGELPPTEAAKRQRAQRVKLGVTGTLVPDVTPRVPTTLSQLSRPASSSAWGRSRHTASTPSLSSRATSSSGRSSTTPSLQALEAKVEAEAARLAAATQRELAVLKKQLAEEARQRKAAEQTIHLLCAKLGVREAKPS
ncbi:hypothetical protein ACHHYP_10853 [Achlya hypogyna]|uniref:Uncharacterized protein n=1 Tax=Achlya hypogyna TaxID=1202772 RepID=A0A1V9YKE6_ACHHY|nr:hypothetical protein ACHHYP_10853 [Achlya hypogyna]